jgi:hypothetical protein
MLTTVWVVLIYWMSFFVACLTAIEVLQDWFYDEVTPRSGLKAAGGALVLALLAAWLRPSFDTMFTSDIAWTLLQAIVWWVVFTLVFQFHPGHATIGIVIMVLVSGLATLGVDSLTKPSRTLAPVQARPNNEPVRKSLAPVPPKSEK